MTQSMYYPVDPWQLCEKTLQADKLKLSETLFSQANGYIGTRGTFEEGLSGYGVCEGTYINGLYLRKPIYYEEAAYGFATHNHKMIQVPDGKYIRILIDGSFFTPSPSDVISHRRDSDFHSGITNRTTTYRVGEKGTITVKVTRLVSLIRQHLMAIDYTVTPDFDCNICLCSGFDAAYNAVPDTQDYDPRAGHLSISESLTEIAYEEREEQISMLHQINDSDRLIASACRHRTTISVNPARSESLLYHTISQKVAAGESLHIEKMVAYHDGLLGEEEAITLQLNHTLGDAPDFAALVEEQATYLENFWKHSDVQIKGDDALQQGIRFNLYQVLQSTGQDGRRAVGAKGLSGPGYDGHYFWDMEIYIIPFFVYTNPEVARSLLKFRYQLLDVSRERARIMSHPHGALYAWRTIGGEECSAFFPASTAQYHINAAIAYATYQYLDATGDWQFMCEYGAEMLFETARIWADIGHFSKTKDGMYCINEVTGPDEYSAMADNNFYTNAMARMHLRFAVAVADHLKKEFSGIYAQLAKRIDLRDEEIARWAKAAELMYLPYDSELNINPQDDGFMHKPRWDFANVPEDKYPLLLHFHPLVIYRYQVLKQADVVLAMALLGGEFPDELRRNNLLYYTPITTHDSTLSTCIYSIESARIGHMGDAYSLFEETARMDLDNIHHNTEYGLHTACMAGSWMSIVLGFAGMQIHEGVLHFFPQIPKKWEGYCCTLHYRKRRFQLDIAMDTISFTLLEGEPMDVVIYGDTCRLDMTKPLHIDYQQKAQAAA